MGSSPIKLPPGFVLEQRKTAPVPPPGFRLEGPPEMTPAPLIEALGGVREMLIPTREELRQMWQTGARGMAKAALQQSKEQLGLAREALVSHPGSPEVLGRTLAAIPPLGPAVAETGEMYATQPMRAVGRTAGLLLPFGWGAALRQVRLTKPTAPVPLLYGERAGGTLAKASQVVSRAVEQSLAGTGVFQRFRARQQTAIQSLVDDIASKVSEFKGGTGELKQMIEGSLKQTKEDLRAPASAMYEEILRETSSTRKKVMEPREVTSKVLGPSGEPVTYTKQVPFMRDVGGIQPETASLKQAARIMQRRIRRQRKLINPSDLTQVEGQLKTILSSPERLPFQTFMDSRSTLLSLLERYGDPLPRRAGAGVRRLTGKVDKAMEAALREVGRDDLVGLWREANDIWFDSSELFNKSLAKKLFDIDPDKVADLMLSGATTASDLVDLKRAVGSPTYNAMAKTALERLVAESMQGESISVAGVTQAGEMIGLRAAERQILRGSDLRGRLEKLGPKLEAMFGEQAASELADLSKVADTITTKSGGTLAGGLFNLYLVSQLFRRGGQFLTGDVVGALSASVEPAAIATFINLAARVMTKPEGIRTVRAMAQAIGRNNNAALVVILPRFADLVDKERGPEGTFALPPPPQLPTLPEVKPSAEGQIQRDIQAGRMTKTQMMERAKQGEIDYRAVRRLERIPTPPISL